MCVVYLRKVQSSYLSKQSFSQMQASEWSRLDGATVANLKQNEAQSARAESTHGGGGGGVISAKKKSSVTTKTRVTYGNSHLACV